MRRGLAILERGSLPGKLWYLSQNLDPHLANATWMAFTPGLPLSLITLLCGLLGAIIVSSLFNLLCWPLRALYRRRGPQSPPPAATAPARIAPEYVSGSSQARSASHRRS